MINFTDIGTGETLVLIHGLGNQREAWNSQLDLSEYFRLIIVELRGHGMSDITDGLTVENYAKDIKEVLDHLEINEAHFCGVSLGGLVIQEFYKRYPNHVKSLVLANTTFCIPSLVGNYISKKTKDFIEKSGTSSYKDISVSSSVFDKDNPDLIKKVEEAFCLREDTLLDSMSSAYGKNYFFDLFSVKVPTLIIGSIEDKITPVINAYVMHYCIKDSLLKIFNHTGHLSNIERKDEFNREVFHHVSSQSSVVYH